ncbi:sugar ABC transporter permease [Paenibacillus darwinianus]|uniref:Sugar ABC transporter permease n=1 Tax=Paenibacillus darwinianus TaxID=1380763 RepID=A0A9W5S1F7_9BACL|nr:carbohydrate ABC transporter permease [Paenibacillus darwinianus]EXX89482.1 sugar ABC transporter permease [Paenibacillus darwinianus]EXX91187.1 sugar ABC transporter permease [Paenibacillus darwinianus]EXX92519.1 sugar ABC transporter permease [Paenibacillus darwinianus]
MGMKRYSFRTFTMEIAAILLAIVFLIPFYFLIGNSLKPFAEILLDSAALPKKLNWDNYAKAWEIMKYPRAFGNSLLITVTSIAGLVWISSMAAYRMVRRPTKYNQILFLLFVAAMVIPFQSIMIPLMRVANWFSLMGSMPGLWFAYLGFGSSLTIFLYHGFVKSIPLEIEESAVVDGCSPYGVFWRIVFPLLKPMTVTIVILNSLWIWNDFLLPQLMLSGPELRTIPLSTFSFFGQYTKKWDLALAALVMGVTPIVIFFLTLQRHIIEGITAGSVKG